MLKLVNGGLGVDAEINTEVEEVYARCAELELNVSSGEAQLLQLRSELVRVEDQLADSGVELEVTKELSIRMIKGIGYDINHVMCPDICRI